MFLLGIIIFSIAIYAAFFLGFILIEALRKKRIPWVLIGSNVICISFFIYLQNLIDDHRLIFFGKYEEGSMEWGKGMANVYVTMQNSLLLILIFAITQVFFWILYRKEMRLLRKQELLNELLEKESEEIPGQG